MLNLNIGILGHVDSGKTTLAKALSHVASTASFDKSPQSQQRGITLDLGFSSFTISTPEHLKGELMDGNVTFTLVDCPGHASLIRTVIGGAQIIDMMLLVVDATKGIQTQTAECIVLGEITCQHLIIVLNKIDLINGTKRSEYIEKMKKRIRRTISSTAFANSPIIPISAEAKMNESIGITDLINKISETAFNPCRNQDAPFVIAIDHCFSIKGIGTIMTGTVLQGNVKVGDEIEISSINITKKVKSIQMFRKPVNSGCAGDRIGLCVTQFDPKLIERGIACKPDYAYYIYCGIMSVNKIKYFKGEIKSKSKFHVTIGYETLLATVTCFSCENKDFTLSHQCKYLDKLNDELVCCGKEYLLLIFERPVLVIENCKVIGSKLDADNYNNNCRLAFWGSLVSSCKDKNYDRSFLSKLQIYKEKSKIGVVDRIIDENTVIAKNLFKKETNIDYFKNLMVILSTGDEGIIEGSFGRSGKVKIYIRSGLRNAEIGNNRLTVKLLYKKFIYESSNKIVQ